MNTITGNLAACAKEAALLASPDCQPKDVWKVVFKHDTAGGVFGSVEEALNKNPDNPDAPLFSILDQMETFRTDWGVFHLNLCYGAKCNVWKQTSNPVTESNITGFVSDGPGDGLAYEYNGLNESWAGLGRNLDTSVTLIDDTPLSAETSWFAIGALKNDSSGKIWGPLGNFIRKVTLKVQVQEIDGK